MERNQELWERFSCHRCGKCCTQLGLPYEGWALQRIADFLGITTDQLVEKYYGRISDDGRHVELDESKKKPCQFLVTEGGRKSCSIHPVRPDGCRAFPFDTDFGTNGVPCPAAAEVYASLGIRRP